MKPRLSTSNPVCHSSSTPTPSRLAVKLISSTAPVPLASVSGRPHQNSALPVVRVDDVPGIPPVIATDCSGAPPPIPNRSYCRQLELHSSSSAQARVAVNVINSTALAPLVTLRMRLLKKSAKKPASSRRRSHDRAILQAATSSRGFTSRSRRAALPYSRWKRRTFDRGRGGVSGAWCLRPGSTETVLPDGPYFGEGANMSVLGY